MANIVGSEATQQRGLLHRQSDMKFDQDLAEFMGFIAEFMRLYGIHARVRHATQAKAAREVPRFKLRILL